MKKLFQNAFRSLRDGFRNFATAFQAILQARRDKRRKESFWKNVDADRRKRADRKQAKGAERTGLDRREKRIQSKMLKAFFRFTKWGEKKGVAFRTTVGPWEYALRFELVAPEQRVICVEIAELFEEAFYSSHTIGDELRTSFFDKVKTIVKTK